LILSNFLDKLPIFFGLFVDEALDMLPGGMFEVIALAPNDFYVLYSSWLD